MSFPPRHHMPMPGMPPMPPGMLPPGYTLPPMPPMMPIGVMPASIMPPGMPMPPVSLNSRPPMGKKPMPPMMPGQKIDDFRRLGGGPTITVFVGNITDRASDNMIKTLLQRCGSVVSWKRVQGASGRLQAFGFCEYADPESGLRAIRLLHDWEIGDKKLVVKVDAKTKLQLDEYKASKKAKRDQDVTEVIAADTDDDLDEDTKREDRVARAGIEATLREHEHELSRSIVANGKEGILNPAYIKRTKLSRAQEALLKISGQGGNGADGEAKDNLDEMDLEEDKKNLIHREIGKFRDTMKKQEEEKERDRERREKDKERRDKDRGDRGERDRDRREKESNRLRNRTPERLREPIQRHHSRSRSRSRERSKDRDREADYDKLKQRDKDFEREREEEEEAYERKKLERKLREKEAAYQERLRNWEARERKKAREYEKEKEKDEERRNDEAKEAKRLKEFLEDYDDERDDPKYYKGSALSRRLKEREKEIENDNRDRQREKEELEELKQKLMEEGHADPTAEFERIKKEREEQFKPRVKVELTDEERECKAKTTVTLPLVDPEVIKARNKAMEVVDDTTQNSLSGFSDLITTPKEETKVKLGFTGLKLATSPNQTHHSSTKRKKLVAGEFFNQDEDDSNDSQPRKRKLVPLEYTDEEKKAVAQPTTNNSTNTTGTTTANSANQEEKRKHIKNLIDKIPTEKDKLFAYGIDWTLVDNNLMERRIKPWINKKIVEYIGEEEPTLVDFICSKVMLGSTPQCILDDVQMVLDEEAEVFVVKMWRLLIYEIEAKKLGLVK
uniref:PWI domain-containing protein n=1 Tax=Strigamia maritima TaxID=126957 RepID=T1IML8_STRMM